MKKKYKIVSLFITLIAGAGFLVGQNNRTPIEAMHNTIDKTLEATTASVNYIENKGQWNSNVLYQGDFNGGRVFLEKNALMYVFYPPGGVERLHPGPNTNRADMRRCTMTFQAVRMQFEGCNPASIEAIDKKLYYCNYFIGNDKSKWASNAGVYGTVNYNNLYPGVSAKIFSDLNNVRYDFTLDPNTNPSEIKLHFDGQNKLSLVNGQLVIHTEIGDITEAEPIAYQEITGKKVNVDCHYTLKDNTLGFTIQGNYDASQPLIIDPTLVFSTFSGSTADNWGMSAAYDAVSNAYTSGICFGVGYSHHNRSIHDYLPGWWHRRGKHLRWF